MKKNQKNKTRKVKKGSRTKGSTPSKIVKKFKKSKGLQKQILEFILNSENQKIGLFALTVFWVTFFIFRFCYPSMFAISDTGSYIDSAVRSKINGYRPIGYSWFLYFIHKISSSILSIHFLQGLLHLVSSLVLVFYINKKFSSNNILKYGFIFLIFFAPVQHYLNNSILSDSYFGSLTLLWLLTGVFMVQRPRFIIIIFHFIFLYLAYQTRYSALFFPIVSGFIFLISFKWKGLIISSLLLVFSVGLILQIQNSNANEMYKTFGVKIQSGFSGWILASNAMNILPYIDKESLNFDSPELNSLHSLILSHGEDIYPKNGITYGFVWGNNMPLKQYLRLQIEKEKKGYLYSWLSVSKIYADYGATILKKYPFVYLKRYIIPNFLRIVYPNEGQIFYYQKTEPNSQMIDWYSGVGEWKDPKFDFISNLKPLVVIFHFLLWIAFLFTLIYGIIQRSWKSMSNDQRIIWFIIALYSAGFVSFSAIVSPFILRFYTALYPELIVLIFIQAWAIIKTIKS